MIRSAQLGVRPSMQMVPYRYDIASHCDLFDVLAYVAYAMPPITRDREA